MIEDNLISEDSDKKPIGTNRLQPTTDDSLPESLAVLIDLLARQAVREHCALEMEKQAMIESGRRPSPPPNQ